MQMYQFFKMNVTMYYKHMLIEKPKKKGLGDEVSAFMSRLNAVTTGMR